MVKKQKGNTMVSRSFGREGPEKQLTKGEIADAAEGEEEIQIELSIDAEDARAGGSGIGNVRVIQPAGRARPMTGKIFFCISCWLGKLANKGFSDTRTDSCITWAKSIARSPRATWIPNRRGRFGSRGE